MAAQASGSSPRAPLALSRKSRERLGRIGDEFLAEVLSLETRRHPGNLDALRELAHMLTAVGRVEEGLQVDLTLLQLCPDDPGVHYNLACSYALLGQASEAFEALEAAIERGYDDAKHLARDEDLASLRGSPRFRDLLERLSRPS